MLGFREMKKFRKTFDFSATNVEIDNYIQSILKGPKVDPDDDAIVSVVGDEDHQYASIKVLKRKLQYREPSNTELRYKDRGF